jgi:alcohol dehydrogenase, propanol-preferring
MIRGPESNPGAGQVCTDLQFVYGELLDPTLPIIPGHEIVGRMPGIGNGVTRLKIGDRVGVAWLG